MLRIRTQTICKVFTILTIMMHETFPWLVMESRPTHRQLREFIILYTLVDKPHMSSPSPKIRDDEHGASFAGEKLRLVQAVSL
jgi:hypothetical protein